MNWWWLVYACCALGFGLSVSLWYDREEPGQLWWTIPFATCAFPVLVFVILWNTILVDILGDRPKGAR